MDTIRKYLLGGNDDGNDLFRFSFVIFYKYNEVTLYRSKNKIHFTNKSILNSALY